MLVGRTTLYGSRVVATLLLFCVLLLGAACGGAIGNADDDKAGNSATKKAVASETNSAGNDTPSKQTGSRQTASDPEDETVLVHRSGAGNIAGNSTYIDDPLTNANPDAALFVTHARIPGGDTVENAHSIGVWYDTGRKKWAIFNQDRAEMPEGAAFNAAVVQEPAETDGLVFVQRAGSGNTAGNSTYIDHPLTNGDPDAVLSIIPNWNPGGEGGIYNDHPVGVWYDADRERWAVFNQDRAEMPKGAAFNVSVTRKSAKTETLVLRATPDTVVDGSVYVDRPFANGKPDAVLSLTQNWNPSGEGGVYNDHPVGIRYDAGREKWAIYNEDGAPIPEGAAFNVTEYSAIGAAVKATNSEDADRKRAKKDSSQEADEPQKTQAPIEGKVAKDALEKVPKFRDFYSEGNPETPKNLVQAGSSAGAIPAVKPFNFGRDPGGPEDKTLYLSVPKIDLYDVPVYNSTSEDDLTKSAVHVPATGFPWQKGANTFIAGHRIGYPDTGSYYVFFRLDELVEGDEIVVTDSDGGRYVYEMREQKVVDPDNVESLNPVEGKSVISLQTCTLPDYAERLIVRGELVEKDV